ncbi:hypothetical protein UlMin_033502 [Ulmus minor]
MWQNMEVLRKMGKHTGITFECAVYMERRLLVRTKHGASKLHKQLVDLLTVHNFYFREGSDTTGVPTKFLTVNCSKYYQPRKSHRTVSVNLQGTKVPLYGAGASFAVLDSVEDGVPMKLVFEVKSKGHVVGKLVKSTHRRRISCSLDIDSGKTKPIKFKHDSCAYE